MTKLEKDKQFVLNVYPSAYCMASSNISRRWIIFEESVIGPRALSVSYISEEVAWNFAKTVVSQRIIKRLAS